MLLLVAPLLVAVQRQETHRQKGETQRQQRKRPLLLLFFSNAQAKGEVTSLAFERLEFLFL
jgi:hypothetical protein